MAKKTSTGKGAKGKTPAKGKIDKKGATDVAVSGQIDLALPNDRDLKHYITQYQLQQRRIAKEQDALSMIASAADAVGVSMGAIKTGIRIQNMKPIEAKAELTQLALVLRELGAPVQFEVYEAKYGDPVAEAKVKGHADGKAGRDRDYGSWIKGSPARTAYDECYAAAQLDNMPIPLEQRRALKAAADKSKAGQGEKALEPAQ